MEISLTTDYAVRAVLHLAASPGRVTAGQIARDQNIPRSYVPKVLQALARAGIVAGSSGRGGGVRLCRDPDGLSVLEIVQAMEGPVALNRCLVRPGECPRDMTCPVHRMWARAQEDLLKTLGDTTVADLLRPGGRADETKEPPSPQSR
ncbi:MAG: Rrf2 family transcriptional regulator [Planctomycetota bacterium]|nr:Rrf2 family transcriptional regulator [Planctomycetota bacterium]